MPSIITVTPYTAIDKVITLEQFLPGKVLQAEKSTQYPAGKGVNVGRTVTSLGEMVTLMGIAGRSNIRDFQNLQSGVITTRFIEAPGETRMNISVFDQMNQLTTHIRTPGFEIKKQHIRELANQLENTITDDDIVVLAGSLPLGAADSTYADFITVGKKAGARVILDASGESLRKGINARPFMIKPNIRELNEAVAQEDLDTVEKIIAAAREIGARGVPLVVVSRGSEGAIAVSGEPEEVWSSKVLSTGGRSPVNHVGCGDALVGGMAVGMSRGLGIPESLRLGVACGTANLFTPGPGQCDPKVIQQMKENTELVQLR